MPGPQLNTGAPLEAIPTEARSSPHSFLALVLVKNVFLLCLFLEEERKRKGKPEVFFFGSGEGVNRAGGRGHGTGSASVATEQIKISSFNQCLMACCPEWASNTTNFTATRSADRCQFIGQQRDFFLKYVIRMQTRLQ